MLSFTLKGQSMNHYFVAYHYQASGGTISGFGNIIITAENVKRITKDNIITFRDLVATYIKDVLKDDNLTDTTVVVINIQRLPI